MGQRKELRRTASDLGSSTRERIGGGGGEAEHLERLLVERLSRSLCLEEKPVRANQW